MAAFRAPSYPRRRRPDAAFNSEAPLLLAPLRRGATTSLSPPHSTSASPGGRFRIGRGQAGLPPEFQTLDGASGERCGGVLPCRWRRNRTGQSPYWLSLYATSI